MEESEQDALLVTPEIQKISKDLLASSKIVSSTAIRGVFKTLIHFRPIMKVKSQRFGYFDLLSHIDRTVNPQKLHLLHYDL